MELIIWIWGFFADMFASGAFFLTFMLASVSYMAEAKCYEYIHGRKWRHKKLIACGHLLFWSIGLTLAFRFIAGG